MIIIMMSTIVVSYLVYHIGKQVGINKRNKELLNNINKFKIDDIKNKEKTNKEKLFEELNDKMEKDLGIKDKLKK